MRILVVEDDSKIGDFLKKGLQEAGYAVDLARDGEEGLDLCSTLPYDAAVVDLMLPKLDGLSMIETIRRQG
ncbi:MAG TPA: response regulator transcription factor, partial [Desulfobulbus sp.]|nr:response regulator transcription factor [Desulfobulbus sp.]